MTSCRTGGGEANGDSSKAASCSGHEEPYRLRAVGHSLGGASLLIYAVTRSMQGEPTHLTRLVLLTPAGFLKSYPMVGHESALAVACCLFMLG